MRVAIVGGGPAGSSLAIRLARRGLNVDLFERARFPRAKPCGEGLMPKALEDLAELGVLEVAEATGQRFAGIAYVCGTHRAEARFPATPGRIDHGLGVSRELLDQAMLERAGSMPGVQLHEETRVNGFRMERGRVRAVCTDRGELPCDVLVGADGRSSLVRRRAGLDGAAPCRPRGALVGRLLGIEGPLPEVVEVHVVPGAEVYLTPVGQGRVQVVVCLEAAALPALAGDGAGAFRRLLGGSPATAALLARAQGMGEVRAVARLSVGARQVASQGIFLAGDAAGFLDPVTGEGTSLALSDTRWLAPLLEELAAGRPLPEVEAAYARAIRGERRQVAVLTHLVLALLRYPWLAGAAIQRLERRPELFRRLVAIAAGLSGFDQVRPAEVLSVLVP